MRKITLTLSFFLSVFVLYTQNHTTGEISLSNDSGLEYSAQIDLSPTTATLTLIGPSDRWLGIGLGVDSMTQDGDVVVFDGTNLTDRTFQGIGNLPTLDSSQDWSIFSNATSMGKRTLVATRDLNTGEPNDFVFTNSPGSIDLVWARGNGATFSLAYHGFGNKGITSSGITLGDENFSLNSFRISPNPAKTSFLVELPIQIDNALIRVYDVLGKEVLSKPLSFENTIDVSSWSNGLYLVKVIANKNTHTKRLIKY